MERGILDLGISDFNEGRYWEAHESWEKNWTQLPEPDRSWMKAMIQVCGVFVHIQKRRRDPALRLALRAMELMAEAIAHREMLGRKEAWALQIVGVDEALLSVIAQLKVLNDTDLNWAELDAIGLKLKAIRE